MARRRKTPSAKEVAAAVEARTWKQGRRPSPAEEAAADARAQERWADRRRLRAICPLSSHDRCRSH
jgi:hypothetical protein